ncbi:PDZ domain-containing protein [Haloferula sargassicola]|uniref:PDZ domain-containing protein n=1 Tax=Haloferula sargassicola TaxID=490096 RepID=A0ABP9UR70_9BACT
MKLAGYFVALFAAVAACQAQETPARETPAVSTEAAKEAAWIGFSVAPLVPEVRAHAPDVPEGVGFLVRQVFDGGPAAKAGVRPYDIVWKLDDQLLVNEAQLATLLRLREPGETVNLAVVRSGQQETVALVLQPKPETGGDSPVSPPEIGRTAPGESGMPWRMVFPQPSLAVKSNNDGSTAEVTKDDDGYLVVIRDADSKVIYNGRVLGEGAAVPESWKESVERLVRVLRRTEERDARLRHPRPRVISPPAGE